VHCQRETAGQALEMRPNRSASGERVGQALRGRVARRCNELMQVAVILDYVHEAAVGEP
jgi:hypothetical protein